MHIKLDLHTHTIASGHATHATITDMAKAAKKKGLHTLGISDHGPKTLGGGKPSYFMSLASAPKKRFGVHMLYGAEVNILDNKGTLDLSNSILKNLDFVIASLHQPVKKPSTIEENTASYIEAMKNPYVSFIGHPDSTHYPVDFDLLIRAAIDNHVQLEINEYSLRFDGYRGNTKFNAMMILELCKYYHYPVLLSSDSHGSQHIGDFTNSLALLRLAKFPEKLILNHSLRLQ